jgi:hypothetical protein
MTLEEINPLNPLVLVNLVRRVQDLETKVFKLETDAIVKRTEQPLDVLTESGLLPDPPTVTKTGKGYRPLLLSEIQEAKSRCKNESACARYLQVSFKTYKKYCRLLQVWEPKR